VWAAIRRALVTTPAHIPAAVEEMLRLETPVQGLCRMTLRPVTLRGTTIPSDVNRGWLSLPLALGA